MKRSFSVRLATVAAATLSTLGTFFPLPARATTFGQTEVSQRDFVAVAAPVGTTRHQLVVIEQVSDARPCWSESGSAPVRVEPLLLNFDFTGICGRATDSNGFSVRVNGRDLGTQYSLRVLREDNDLVLKAVPFGGSGGAIEIGRTHGATSDFAKIHLNPGWRFTKRNYQGQSLGHIYFTNDRPLSALLEAETTPIATTPEPISTSVREVPTSEVPTFEVPTSEVPTSEVPTSEVTVNPTPATPEPVTASQPSPFDELDVAEEHRAYLRQVWQQYEIAIDNQRYAIATAERQLSAAIERGASERTIRRYQQNLTNEGFTGAISPALYLKGERRDTWTPLEKSIPLDGDETSICIGYGLWHTIAM
ncbi:DUF3747 domain-containing protein [Baaleninema sp.]|uniref:DUF3747 domain-containing protein n=1 Tax=Baaleninema sp. TaxID=3101197 RepID=UPI003D0501C9